MNERDQKMAYVLLFLTERVIKKRRLMEATCGYPTEYGDDGELVKKISEFVEKDDLLKEFSVERQKLTDLSNNNIWE